ncbi:MAG: hypothetical protein J6D44_18840 [Pseudomonas sp.]|nr:hypothetical protein [Pseudomonas sp.]
MSNIPEGATHKIQLFAGVGYRRQAHGGWEGYVDGDWVLLCSGMPSGYEPIQTEPEWTGEGLPPVGMDCEWKGITRNGWAKVSIIAHGKEEGDFVAIAQAENEVVLGASDRFRLIRTPEQIAAEKRDAAIKEMQRLVGSCNTFPFAELYDYGYRLQVEK